MTREDPAEVVMKRDVSVVKDKGYAWVILAASFITLTINWGLVLCFGIYFVTLLDHFQCTRRDVATVGALAYGVLCFAGPLSTHMEDRYGARTTVMTGSVLSSLGMILTYFATRIWHVYISFGLLGGLGFSFMYIPCFAVLPRYFDRYQYFVTSFATVGSALGNLLFSNVSYYFIDLYTWRGSMIINAGILLQCLICGALMRDNGEGRRKGTLSSGKMLKLYIKGILPSLRGSSPSERGQRDEMVTHGDKIIPESGIRNGQVSSGLTLFKEMKYLMFLVECFCYGGSSYVVFSLINELIIEHGLSIGDSALLVSVIGAFNIIGRVGASIITHCQCTDRPLFFAFTTAFLTISIFATTACYDFSSFAFSLSVFGLTYGVKTSQIAAVLIDLFGIERMTTGMAYGVLCSGLGGFAVPPLAGWLADASSLEASFLLAAAFSCVAFGSCVMIVVLHRQKRPDPQNELDAVNLTGEDC